MNMPALLRRRAEEEGAEAVTVAKGPLVILAHGLLAVPADRRHGYWISSPMGEIGPAQAEAALRTWMRPAATA